MQLMSGLTALTDSQFLRYLKRVCPKHADQLVEYRSLLTGSRVIAVWVDRLGGRVQDLVTLAPGEAPTHDTVLQVQFNLSSERRLAALRRLANEQVSLARDSKRSQDELTDNERTIRKVYAKQAGLPADHPGLCPSRVSY